MRLMKIYLAARYSRRDELRGYAKKLIFMGHSVTSRWLDTSWGNQGGGSSAAPPEYRKQYAAIDMEDVKAADCVINFTEPPLDGGRGGRHVEFGMAMAWGKKLIVVGYRENLFHEHDSVIFVNTPAEMLELVSPSRVLKGH